MKYLRVGEKKEGVRVAEPPFAAADDDVIDLRYLFRVWLRWSWVPLLFVLVGGYIGYRDLQRFQPEYVASLTVLPASGSSTQVSRIAPTSLLGNLGLSFGAAAPTSTFDRFKIMLGSVSLAQRLQDKHSLMQEVFAGSWDASKGRWKKPTGEDFERDQRRRSALKLSKWQAPNIESLASYIGGGFKLEKVEGTGFVNVAYKHVDPDFALRFLNLVYLEADEFLREQDRIASRTRRAWVEKQLQRARVLDTRQALIGLLASEERTAMLLESDLPYAARIIDPPFVSSRPTEPALKLVFGVPMFLAAALGFLLITLVAVFRRE